MMGQGTPMITTFRGKPIDQMDRTELIETIQFLAAEYQRNNSPQAIRARSLGHVEMMKRGER